jgi:hypothetical protein
LFKLLKDIILEVLRATSPLVIVTIILQFTLVKASDELFLHFMVGSLLVIIGMAFFLFGIEYGILPAGNAFGSDQTEGGSPRLILTIAVIIGFATTIAEPDVMVLAAQASGLSQGAIPKDSLIYVIGIGVAFFIAMGMMRILLGFPISSLLIVSYLIVIVLSLFTPPAFVPLAFDSGSVTTGALTAPIIMALGIGLSSVTAGRSAIADGFGLIGLASIGPIIAVMIMGIITA